MRELEFENCDFRASIGVGNGGREVNKVVFVVVGGLNVRLEMTWVS